MEFKDYYELLGVKPDASADEIKSAYRRLARKYHPDVSKERNAEDRFKDLNEAFEALRDPQRRAAYDQLRVGGFRAGDQFRPPPGFRQPGGFEFDMNDGGGQFSDFFESLFGRARAGSAAGNKRNSRPPPTESRAELEVDLETVYAGGTQRVSLQDARETRTLEVRIPKGIQTGQSIRLSGQGAIGPDGKPGDVLLQVRVRPHRLYTVEGRNLHLSLPISPWEAALGAKVSVPTLGGAVELSIPPGSQSGRKLRLKGRGLPGPEPGDQLVQLEIRAPAATNDAEREAYAALQRQFSTFDPRKDLR